MRLKGEKVFKVEKDGIGIRGMAGAQASENTWLEELHYVTRKQSGGCGRL